MVIEITFEKRAPSVRARWGHEGEGIRLLDWIDQVPRLRKLLDDAVMLELEDPSWEDAA
jgi:hypothetical protein